MTKTEAKQRIEKLRDSINHYRYLYHVLDKTEISEQALDSLKKELFDLEQQFSDLITPDSPTQRIGGKPLEKFSKVRHEKPMLSWTDAFSFQDLEDWLERNKKLLSPSDSEKIDFYCEPKLDGLAVELIYRQGILFEGATRGDGIIGEEVTQNLKTIESIPLKLRDLDEVIPDLKSKKLLNTVFILKKRDLDKVIVRGEVIATKKEFAEVNREQKRQELSVFANVRNFAAGSIRQLDPKVSSARKLDAMMWELVTDFGQETHAQGHQILETLGFKTNNKYNRLCRNLQEVLAFREELQKNRDKLNYEIDGIVVLINNNQVFAKLGVVGKGPRGIIAFKFPLKQATTIVQDVVFQVGRTGAITPVAVLKPVEVGGTTISRATLHNEDEIKRLGLKIGDTVIVGRAGDVIPDIIKSLAELRGGKEKNIVFPRECPACKTKLAKSAGEVVWRCPNKLCRAVQRKRFYHFVIRTAFDIQGLGPKIIDKLLEANLISDPADLFFLEVGDILPTVEGLPRSKSKALLSGFGEKSAENLILAIKTKKRIVLPKFIFSLGIRNIGEETAQDLAEYFGNLESLKKASLEDLQKIKDIGPVAAKSLLDYFKEKRNSEFLKKLEKAGVKIESVKRKAKSEKLRSLTFVLTGSLVSMTRNEAKEKIRKRGGEISESISKNTSFLIAGLNPGSKLKKAKDLGVKVLTEAELLKILK